MIDLSSVKVYDDLLDDRFILDIDEETNNYPWRLNNIANRKSWPYGKKGSHLIWGVIFKPNGQLQTPKNLLDLYSFLNSSFLKDKYNLNAIILNGQSLGQEGTTHVDGTKDDDGYTLMVFINYKWKKEWGGEFQLIDENEKVIKSIEYIPGRIIFFKGDIPHRGLAPKEPYVVRKSLVYRLTKKKNEL